jgi:O-antigen ligase
MGSASSKKKNRPKASSSKSSLKSSGRILFRSNPVVLFEDTVIGLIFFSIALLLSTKNLVPFTLPKLVALRIGTLLLLVLAGYRLWKGQIWPVSKPILLAGASLGLWWIFSTFFAIHKPTALNGFFGRYNGLWTHEICLLLFLIIATMGVDPNRARRILLLFVAALVPVALYAVVQYFQLDPIPWSTRWERSVSTIGHGVTLAALLGMALPFILLFFIEAKTTLKKSGWLICLLFFIWAMGSTLSRGPWVGTFIASMIVVISRLKPRNTNWPLSRDKTLTRFSASVLKKWGRPGRFFYIVIFLLAFFSGFFLISGGGQKIAARFKTFTDLKMDTSFYGRLLYSQAALKGIKDYPLVGIGFENFRNIYPRYRLAEDNEIFTDTIPTMVHNGYLQIALENGIPGLALYLTLVAFVLIHLIREYF